MLRFASSVVQSVSALVRSPLESLTHAWGRVQEALIDIERQQQLEQTGQLDHLAVALPAGGSHIPPSSTSPTPSPSWCTPALVNALNSMVDAVRKEAGDKHLPNHNKPPAAIPSIAATSPSPTPAPLSFSLPSSPSPSLSKPTSPLPSVPSLSPAFPTPAPASFAPRRVTCADYLQQEHAIETLARYALTNRPVGLRVLLTRTIDALLTACAAPLLARRDVILAVVSLLQRSGTDGELKRKNSGRLPLLTLCRTIAGKIKASEPTAAVWMQQPDPSEQSNGGEHAPSPPSSPPALLVASLLVSMVNFFSAEGRLAAAGLFDLACTPHQLALQSFIVQSPFAALLVAGVVELVAQLPPVSSCPPFAVLFRTNEAASQLLERLQLIDALCTRGPSELADAICSHYTIALLQGAITPMLLDVRRHTAGPDLLLASHGVDADSGCGTVLLLSADVGARRRGELGHAVCAPLHAGSH